MRLSVALLRNVDAEVRAKEKAEAPTVRTKEQTAKDDEIRSKYGMTVKEGQAARQAVPPRQSVWKRKFRPLPEAKAVDLFADVIGDGFILFVAGGLIIYEYWKSSQKPDHNLERIKELDSRLDELKKQEEEREERERKQQSRILALEAALRSMKDPKTKQPLLPSPTEVAA